MNGKVPDKLLTPPPSGSKAGLLGAGQVLQGDCLELMKQIPAKSVDLILCDLPYGTTNNKWDSVIPLDEMWKEYKRIITDTGAIVLTAQGPFTARLILSNERMYKYKMTWVKSKATGFLNSKRQPLRRHEDVVVFYKKQPTYNPQFTPGEAYNKGVRKAQQTGSYGEFKATEVKSAGKRYPTDVFYFKTAESEGHVWHSTQKPVELGRYLIRQYSNPGDFVLDNACGSGSFLVAAKLEGRNYLGMELNEDVYNKKKEKMDMIEICNQRLEACYLK